MATVVHACIHVQQSFGLYIAYRTKAKPGFNTHTAQNSSPSASTVQKLAEQAMPPGVDY